MKYLKVLQGNDCGLEWEISLFPFTLGRGRNASFVLNDPSVSRLHATIYEENGRFYIKDENSNNGTWVNGQKVSVTEIGAGDFIKIGNTSLEIFSSQIKKVLNPSSVIITSGSSDMDSEKSIVMDVREFQQLEQQLSGETITEDLNRTRKDFRKLQAMLRISKAVAHIFDLKELIEELMEIIFLETHATRGFIMLFDESGELVPMAIRRKDQQNDAITISNTIINTVIDQKKALLSSDLLNDERFESGMSIIAHQIRSCICAPLIFHDEVLGVIHVDSNVTANIFDQEDLELLVAIANQAAACIKNTLLIKKIREEENKRGKLSQFFPPAQVAMLMNDKLNISLGGKKEDVTIIFCDIRQFTSISEGMDAIEVMNFLNEFFSVMTDIIFKHEGMVDNFMGDCIMAVFGGPFCVENDPVRAVEAAIEMQKAQKDLNAKFELEGRKTFGIGIGIHSGLVSRGNIGSLQLKKYTVIGSNVNVCSRLCSLAKAGDILISSDTAKRISDKIPMEKLNAVKVKNVSEPLIPFRVVYQ